MAWKKVALLLLMLITASAVMLVRGRRDPICVTFRLPLLSAANRAPAGAAGLLAVHHGPLPRRSLARGVK